MIFIVATKIFTKLNCCKTTKTLPIRVFQIKAIKKWGAIIRKNKSSIQYNQEKRKKRKWLLFQQKYIDSLFNVDIGLAFSSINLHFCSIDAQLLKGIDNK